MRVRIPVILICLREMEKCPGDMHGCLYYCRYSWVPDVGKLCAIFWFPVHPEFKSYFSYMSSCIQLRRNLMYLKVAVQYPYQRFHS